MKYPNWHDYTQEQKWDALREELSLETHNGTTKEDLLNVMKFQDEYVKHLQTEVSELENKCGDIVTWLIYNGHGDIGRMVKYEFDIND